MRELSLDLKVLDELKRAKENNRLLHLYLFYGDDNQKLIDTAYAFASSFYCGCLNCNICEQIVNNNNLNVKFLSILDGKTMISKEQINDLMAEFQMTSLSEGTRIFIIDGIDKTTVQAQNSLLKFIEEPDNKEEIIGILLANNIDAVLNTIKSRAGLIYFSDISREEVITNLSQMYDLDDAFILSDFIKSTTNSNLIYESDLFLNVSNIFKEFININNKKDGIVFYNKYKKISKQEFEHFISLLTYFYTLVVNNDKLLSSAIYDKINILNNELDIITKKQRLTLLLDIENKLSYNVIHKYLLHYLIENFF